jgi:hypothetical protein
MEEQIMASTPRLKVYNREGGYVASFKHAEDAAILIAGLGEESQIRDGHKFVVWHEGHEIQPAMESYDTVAECVYARIEAGPGKGTPATLKFVVVTPEEEAAILNG